MKTELKHTYLQAVMLNSRGGTSQLDALREGVALAAELNTTVQVIHNGLGCEISFEKIMKSLPDFKALKS